MEKELNYVKNEQSSNTEVPVVKNTGRYLLFNISPYYPKGGMEDLVIRFNKVSELANIRCAEEMVIYDLEENEQIFSKWYVDYEDCENNLMIDVEKDCPCMQR